MKKFFINYHTGAGNKYASTLEQAKAIGDEGAAYTQENITIEDGDGKVILTRYWFGGEF